MKVVLLSTLVLLVLFGSSDAQTEKIARLRSSALHASDEKDLLRSNLLLLYEHESLFKDSLLPLAQRTVALAKKAGSKVETGQAVIGLVNAYMRVDEASRADSIIEATIPDYPVSDNGTGRIQLLLRLAKTNILASRADYEGAVKELFEIIRDAEKLQDLSVQARCLNELGVIAYNRDQLDDALNYCRKALSLGDAHAQAEQAKAYSWINIAMVYAWREQYDSALYFINNAKPVCERIENLYYLANAYAVEANIYKWSKRMPLAEHAMLKMVALRERTEGQIIFSNEQLSLANFYVYANDCSKAISIYKSGLDYASRRKADGIPSNFETELRYYEGLARCYHSEGSRDQYESALQYIVALKDSIYEKNSSEAIAEMQTKYEVQKKETTIIAQKLALTRQNFLFYGALMLSALVAIIGWLLFRGYRRKSRLKLFLVQEEEKRRAVQAVKDAEEAERKRIAADLHDSLGSYAASIKSNADEMKRSQTVADPALDLLQSNSQQMVALLSDTIWAMRKDSMKLSDISDRTKVVMQRLRQNYPLIRLQVTEELEDNTILPPVNAYHVFMIVQEGINNALRHSGGNQITVHFQGGNDWFVSVSDNGIGFHESNGTADGGNGLFNMRSRAAGMDYSIEWKSKEPKGTEIVLRSNSN